MQKHEWFDALSGEILAEMSRHVAQRTEAVVEAKGFVDWDSSLADLALATEPLPLTVGSVLARQPCISSDRIALELAESAGRGVLHPSDGDGYRLADEARRALILVQRAVEQGLDSVAAVAPVGTASLARTLEHQVAACADEAAFDTPCLDGSRAFDPGAEAPVLLRIRRALIDLFSFRDDARIAAWQGVGVTGSEWEALSHLWGRNIWGPPVGTLDELAERLASRGYDRDDYASAIARLAERGWVEEMDGRLALTRRGVAVREEAEEAADCYFFASWRLEADEAGRLRVRLEALRDALAAVR